MPTIGEIVAALPPDLEDDSLHRAALPELLSGLARRPVPTGRLTRLWALGTLQAKIAAGYFAWWLRTGFASRDDKEYRSQQLVPRCDGSAEISVSGDSGPIEQVQSGIGSRRANENIAEPRTTRGI